MEGKLHQDEKLTRQGYFMLLDAIKAWPEFDLFTAGFVMSRLPADSPQFREGLEWEWRNLDDASRESQSRQPGLLALHVQGNPRGEKTGLLEFLDCAP